MEKEIDKKRIENAVKEILLAIGENPEREGLKETPQRVARMYEEVFEGVKYSNKEIVVLSSETDATERKGKEESFSVIKGGLTLIYTFKLSS